MAKRTTKIYPIKSAKKIPTESGKIHNVVLIQRATYWDAICRTCHMQCICGGDGAKQILINWAEWHSSKTNIETKEE